MEAKLKEYRARRRRQEFVEKTTEKFENTKRRFVDLFRKMIKIDIDESEVGIAPAFREVPAKPIVKKSQLEKNYESSNRNKNNKEEKQSLIELDSETNEDELEEETPQKTWRVILKWSFYTLMWVALYFYFITLQFGAVFFAISLLIFIIITCFSEGNARKPA